MPKIQANTLIEHRAMRRDALLAAAVSIALESGGSAVTMAEVAKRAGISRSSVYEYFESSADLIADVILDELDIWAKTLSTAVEAEPNPETTSPRAFARCCSTPTRESLRRASSTHEIGSTINQCA
jgi:AcrR family transcriptional regulator